MAKILSIETATDACSVALSDNGKIVELFELAAQSHTKKLLPMVESLLESDKTSLSEVDAIAYSAGPGSFTGLRIGIGVVQGLAFGANKPVIPVSTLLALAEMYYFDKKEQTGVIANEAVLVALDARMSEVYWGLFSGQACIPKILSEPAVIAPKFVATADVLMQVDAPIVGIGSGCQYEDLQAVTAQYEVEVYPRAASIARLAEQYYLQGLQQSVFLAEPEYVRNTVSWKKRQKIRSESEL